ncbi:MAG: glycosyltransferase family 4 protein [SAR324 cluster bacterium]|nr:glycosyltransferase family 4 protein [SAR324 cluster bacterium]
MIYFLAAAFLATFCLTFLLRIYALKRNIMDIPNMRSSHSIPTPRGGGVSIVVVFLLVLAGYFAEGWLPPTKGILILVASFSVALVGWFDDRNHIPASVRLTIHLFSSALIVYAFSGLPLFTAFGFEVDFSLAGYVIALFALVWILNLFNFMDGIDGIASSETITTTVVAGLILYFVFGFAQAAYLHFLLAASVMGFLVWNFPPAKIFMGDAASGFLGLTHGMLILYTTHLDPTMLWVWLILLAVFISDASVTLFRRVARGEKAHVAHRSHAYQWASRMTGSYPKLTGSHTKVTLAVIAINLVWLGPLAYLTATTKIDGALATIIAYIPLIILAIKLKAGIAEDSTSN